jgi:hypothetical protein
MAMIRGVRGLAIGIVATALTGCTVINVGAGEQIDMLAVGVVRVRVPVVADGLVAVERSGVGLGWDSLPGGGAYLGWSEGKWVIADPAKCQLLVIVRTADQAASAKTILSEWEGDSPCIVDQSESSPR